MFQKSRHGESGTRITTCAALAMSRPEVSSIKRSRVFPNRKPDTTGCERANGTLDYAPAPQMNERYDPCHRPSSRPRLYFYPMFYPAMMPACRYERE